MLGAGNEQLPVRRVVSVADRNVYDSDRLTYLRSGMMQQQRATVEGIPLKSNFYRSAADNLEWTDGRREAAA